MEIESTFRVRNTGKLNSVQLTEVGSKELVWYRKVVFETPPAVRGVVDMNYVRWGWFCCLAQVWISPQSRLAMLAGRLESASPDPQSFSWFGDSRFAGT